MEINPQRSCELVLSPLDDTAVSDGTFTIDRVELQAGPQILLESTGVPGRLYRVQEITP